MVREIVGNGIVVATIDGFKGQEEAEVISSSSTREEKIMRSVLTLKAVDSGHLVSQIIKTFFQHGILFFIGTDQDNLTFRDQFV